MKKAIINNATQPVLIVFSVVLGLFLSDRIEDYKENQDAEKLMEKIRIEVIDNMRLIKHWAPYHQEIAASLMKYSNDSVFIEAFIDDQSVLFDKVLTKGTFMSRMPANDAWDIAKSHPLIVNFDYDELLILSRVYNQQATTFKPSEKISDLFLSSELNSPQKAKSNLIAFKSSMQEIASREQQLLEFYETAYKILELEELDKNTP